MFKNSIYGSYFWVLGLGVVFALVSLIHIEVSRAKTFQSVENKSVTVERLPSSEARRMGVQSN